MYISPYLLYISLCLLSCSRVPRVRVLTYCNKFRVFYCIASAPMYIHEPYGGQSSSSPTRSSSASTEKSSSQAAYISCGVSITLDMITDALTLFPPFTPSSRSRRTSILTCWLVLKVHHPLRQVSIFSGSTVIFHTQLTCLSVIQCEC